MSILLGQEGREGFWGNGIWVGRGRGLGLVKQGTGTNHIGLVHPSHRRAPFQNYPPNTATPTTSPIWMCDSSQHHLLRNPPHPHLPWHPLLPAPLLNPSLNSQLNPQLSHQSPRLCPWPHPLNLPGPSPEPGPLKKVKIPGPLGSRSGRGFAGSGCGCCSPSRRAVGSRKMSEKWQSLWNSLAQLCDLTRYLETCGAAAFVMRRVMGPLTGPPAC